MDSKLSECNQKTLLEQNTPNHPRVMPYPFSNLYAYPSTFQALSNGLTPENPDTVGSCTEVCL